jgi:hypothetical protein
MIPVVHKERKVKVGNSLFYGDKTFPEVLFNGFGRETESRSPELQGLNRLRAEPRAIMPIPLV